MTALAWTFALGALFGAGLLYAVQRAALWVSVWLLDSTVHLTVEELPDEIP